MSLSLRERDLIRHALGLRQGNKVAYRNHFVAGGDDLPAWRKLAERGLAHEWQSSSHSDPIFMALSPGINLALEPGESLDHEEWEKVKRIEQKRAGTGLPVG